jgi:S-adenosylmethionine synthetase
MAVDWNKIISAEVLTTSGALIFAGGIAYATLANGQELAEQQIKQLQSKQADMQASISDIQKDTAVLNSDQKHILRMVEEQRQDIRQILKIMQEEESDK